MLDIILRNILVLLEPVGLIWLGLLALTLFLFRRRQFAAAAMALALVLFVYLVGATGFSGSLLGSLEKPYAGFQPDAAPTCDAVVMLGGGSEPSRFEADEFHLTPAGDRLHMALEMAWLRKAPALVLGGGSEEFEGKYISESELVARWFQKWKKAGALDPNLQIIPLSPCGNTHDEALGVRALATAHGWHRILLVTSANHMRRASALFRTQGLDVVPAPCNFLTSVSTAPSAPGIGIPYWGGFEKISTWMHEESGWLEYRRRGWIK